MFGAERGGNPGDYCRSPFSSRFVYCTVIRHVFSLLFLLLPSPPQCRRMILYTHTQIQSSWYTHNIRASSSISSYACRIGWIARRILRNNNNNKKEKKKKKKLWGKLDFLIFYHLYIYTHIIYTHGAHPSTQGSFLTKREREWLATVECSRLNWWAPRVYSVFDLCQIACGWMVHAWSEEWYYIEFTIAKCRNV